MKTLRQTLRKCSALAGAFLAVLTVLTLFAAPSFGQGTLFVEGNNVGIGTGTPGRKLEVVGTDGINTQIKVSNQTTPAASRAVLVMENNGPVQVFYLNTDSGLGWQLSAAADGFSNSLLGTGGPEFRIDNDGRVRMGPGGVINFNLDPGGDLLIPNGSVFANGVQLTSSRALKQDFQPVDSTDILSRLAALPVTEWSFKTGEDGIRHIGPFAEDFYAAFGLGAADTSISVTDIAGVTVSAVQGLNKIVEEKDAQIKDLQDRQTELNNRIEQLEAVVQRLAAAQPAAAD